MKYEYNVTVLANHPAREDYLDKLGQDGWELVSVTAVDGHERAYLKRPLEARSLASSDKDAPRWCIGRGYETGVWCRRPDPFCVLTEGGAALTSSPVCEACAKALTDGILSRVGR